MSYAGLGENIFGRMSCDINPSGWDYLAAGSAGYQALEAVMQEAVAVLLSGASGEVELCGDVIARLSPAPDIAAIFGPREQTARILAAAVLATVVSRERSRQPATARMVLRNTATRAIDELVLAMKHGGDPAACEMQFEESFRQWAALTDLAVGEDISRTGWCEKSFVLPMGPDGHVQACLASPICKSTIGGPPTYARVYIPAKAPAPGDPRVSVKVPGSVPVAPPTKAEIEAEIARKMKAGGESFADRETKQEYTEIAAYLGALGQAKGALAMALGLSAKAPDSDVVRALSSLGVSAREAVDWFDGCNLDPNCFREQMNIAVGEAKRAVRDNRAKTVVAVGAVVALGLFVFWRR